MRKLQATVTLACALVTLCGCAGQSVRPAPDYKPLFAAMGNACERSGYARGTAEWQGCVLQLAKQAEPPKPALPPSRTVICTPNMGSVICTEN